MMTTTLRDQPLALYVHIPFCARLCHYCDFAKTAHFTDEHVTRYLDVVRLHFKLWKQYLKQGQRLYSVYFGGGTPGLLTDHYQELMADILAMTALDAEVTLEVNPLNVTSENLKIWRGIGFNRISLGVQTFDPQGLKVLTRDHSERDARRALDLAARSFPKSNGDLIYGWNGQTPTSWLSDLACMAESGVNHVSAYALTYEGQTPLARSQRRGVVQAMCGDEVANHYDLARDYLSAHGFRHEEISNWSKPGGEGRHNWVYWRGQHYIGIGAGSHGFVNDGNVIGLRYSYPNDLRTFLRQGSMLPAEYVGLKDLIKTSGGVIESDRDVQSWVYEYVGSGLRCEDGIDLGWLSNVGFELQPNQFVRRAIDDGLLLIDGYRLWARPDQWFRETAWSLEVCRSIVPG